MDAMDTTDNQNTAMDATDSQNTAMDTDNQNTAKDIWINWIQSSVEDRLVFKLSPEIFVVPENLKKWNQDAYTPQVVSIGPRFKRTRDEFLFMDEVKENCMVSLISRAASDRTVFFPIDEAIIEKCGNVVWELEEQVRASYITKIEFDKQQLVQIILVDACFLLELLISISKELNSKFSTSMYPAPAAEVLKDEVVLSDLLLFENQIPLRILHELSGILFPEVFQYERIFTSDHRAFQFKDQTPEKINNLALSVFGYSPLLTSCPQSSYILDLNPESVSHILDLVHFHVNRSKVESTTAPDTQQEDRRVNMDSNDTTLSLQQQQQVKLKRCALRLLTSGVTIKVKLPEDDNSTDSGALSYFSWVWNAVSAILSWPFFMKVNKHLEDEGYIHELKGLDFWFKFENGKLEIEQLHITKITKVKWCNIIASEHQQSIKRRSNDGNVVKGGKFTLAALIFNGLICSEDDVQLLKDKKIVVDHLKMTNQELMDFFRKIELGAHGVVNSSNYIQMVNDINDFSKAFLIKRIWSTVLNSFTYRQEWLLRFMNRNYNFVATVVFILTVMQTVYAILAYYFPK